MQKNLEFNYTKTQPFGNLPECSDNGEPSTDKWMNNSQYTNGAKGKRDFKRKRRR